jgi:hypothetical protein
MKKKHLLLSIIAVAVLASLVLPYGRFTWQALGQYYVTEEVREAAPEAPVSFTLPGLLRRILGLPGVTQNDTTLFVFGNRADAYGDCVASSCGFLFRFDPANPPADGEVIYENGQLTVISFTSGNGVYELLFFVNGDATISVTITVQNGVIVSVA